MHALHDGLGVSRRPWVEQNRGFAENRSSCHGERWEIRGGSVPWLLLGEGHFNTPLRLWNLHWDVYCRGVSPNVLLNSFISRLDFWPVLEPWYTSLCKHVSLVWCSNACDWQDAEGKSHSVVRSELRHRVFVKQAHAGVTGDKKHDRFSPFTCLGCLFVCDHSRSSHCLLCGLATACDSSLLRLWSTWKPRVGIMGSLSGTHSFWKCFVFTRITHHGILKVPSPFTGFQSRFWRWASCRFCGILEHLATEKYITTLLSFYSALFYCPCLLKSRVMLFKTKLLFIFVS